MGISFLDKAGGHGGKGRLSSQETASTKSWRHTRARLVTAEWAEHRSTGYVSGMKCSLLRVNCHLSTRTLGLNSVGNRELSIQCA